MDRIKLIDNWPSEEELARIQGVDLQGGGSAHNVGIDLCKLDPSLPVAAIGLLGHDEDGDFLFQQATSHQMDTSQLHRTNQSSTSYTDVMSVIGSGKRTFFHYTGSNDLLSPEHFDFSNSKARILHLGLLSLHAKLDAPTPDGENGWVTVLKKAKSHSLETSIEMVSVDPAINRALVTPCLPYLDYLIVNDHELGSIANIDTLHENQTQINQCLIAAHKVLAMGAMKLVTVHYPDGAICVTRDGGEFMTTALTLPQSLVVGSVGAGDAFVAGFLYAMHEQWSVPDALSLAHAVAAASLRSATTVGAVETVEQCQQFARQYS